MVKLDEDQFLAELLPSLRQSEGVMIGPGDDCAALYSLRDGIVQLVGIDQVAAGVHFHGPNSDTPLEPTLAGRKLLARNLSDIAAMGGRPEYAVVSLAVPTDCPKTWVAGFMNGLQKLADKHDVSIVGGDTGSAMSIVCGLTILGSMREDDVCTRDRAEAGDRIYVTGRFGGSLASGRHATFDPRLAEGQWLAENGLSRCMIDVSDGLLKDLGRVCLASQLGAAVDVNIVPRHDDTSVEGALTDGEDYELLIAIPQAKTAQLEAEWSFATPLTCIGEFTAGAPMVCDQDGSNLTDRFGQGFEHFGD
jgi:thiamine-monophosphate kinase